MLARRWALTRSTTVHASIAGTLIFASCVFKLNQLSLDLLDDKEEMSAFFSLVDIIFAFAYNKRTMLGENTVLAK